MGMRRDWDRDAQAGPAWAQNLVIRRADDREAFVHEADLELAEGTDPRAPGAAVTIELCGSTDHEGPCRWPNNHDFEISDAGFIFRTLFVAPPSDELEIRRRIDHALRAGEGWTVIDTRSRAVSADEQPLAERLARTPQP